MARGREKAARDEEEKRLSAAREAQEHAERALRHGVKRNVKRPTVAVLRATRDAETSQRAAEWRRKDGMLSRMTEQVSRVLQQREANKDRAARLTRAASAEVKEHEWGDSDGEA